MRHPQGKQASEHKCAAAHAEAGAACGARAAHLVSCAYQRPVILTSLGALAPRSVSEGCTLSNTPAISPVPASTLATLNTAEPGGRQQGATGACCARWPRTQ